MALKTGESKSFFCFYFFRNFINLIFPPGICRICGTKVNYGLPQICFSCLKKIQKVKEPFCNICGRAMAETAEIGVCGDCLKEPPSYEKHISLYLYEGAIREMVLAYKVLKRYPFYRIFGKSIAKNVKNKMGNIAFDLVAFIPTPFIRRIMRGFSPAELIAKKCGRELNLPVKNILKLKKRTKPQKNLGAKERKENLKGAFDCKEDLRGKNVLLIDDIFTTGTTIEEASRILKKCGAKVYAATFAIRKKREIDLPSIED